MEKNIFAQLLRDRESFYEGIFGRKEIGKTALQLIVGNIGLFALYGFVMGIYNSPLQAVSAAVKVPLMFLLTLIICYPALFIFNVLLGSKLSIGQSLVMMLSAYTLIACVLASFAPIVLFFLMIGSSYAFLRLLHIAIFGIAGITGMIVMKNGLMYACEQHSIYPRQGVRVFQVWVLIFAFVGTQLAWNLRPFLGNKELPFQLFRKQESNFYAHTFHTIGEFLLGQSKPKHRSPANSSSGGVSGEIEYPGRLNIDSSHAKMMQKHTVYLADSANTGEHRGKR